MADSKIARFTFLLDNEEQRECLNELLKGTWMNVYGTIYDANDNVQGLLRMGYDVIDGVTRHVATLTIY